VAGTNQDSDVALGLDNLAEFYRTNLPNDEGPLNDALGSLVEICRATDRLDAADSLAAVLASGETPDAGGGG
jgi:hypothetical protein